MRLYRVVREMLGLVRVMACVAAVAAVPALTGRAADDTAAATGHLARAHALAAERNWSGALAEARKAVEVAPSNASARLALGTALVETGESAEGIGVLEAVATADPGNGEALNNIAWAYLKATNPEIRDIGKALSYARRALLERPNSPEVWATVAEAYYESDKPARAVRAARIAAALSQSMDNASRGDLVDLIVRCERALKRETAPDGSSVAERK